MGAILDRCKECNKIAIEDTRMDLGAETLINLKCGHFTFSHKLASDEKVKDSFTSNKGEELYPFQDDSLKFIFDSGGRCLIGHEQGLGKTVIGLAALAQKKEMLPALTICKTKLSFQWMKQVINWLPKGTLPQIITSSKDYIIPGMHFYIISYDLLRRMDDEFFKDMEKIQTVIIDECQHIKNHNSTRTNKVRKLVKSKPYLIALSGTPIKNNAGEFFPILNLLKPERFPSYESFLNNHCDSYWNGRTYKLGGLRDPKHFHKLIGDIFLRYEQKEVLPDLPPLSRTFQYTEIDKSIKAAYDKQVDALSDLIDSEGDNAFSFANYSNILAYLNRMRQITAVSKIDNCVDFVTDFLLTTERKIIIFLHHHLAREILINKLKVWCEDGAFEAPLVIKEGMSSAAQEEVKRKFREDKEHRIIILGTLSSGEGMDGLQDSCSDIMILERQWNPSNEEQAEKRVHRIGQTRNVKITYLVALGTCDEYFAELVEQKRQICKESYGDSGVVAWQETDMVRELVSMITSKREGKSWNFGV